MKKLAGVFLILVGLLIIAGTLFSTVIEWKPAPQDGAGQAVTESELGNTDRIEVNFSSADINIETHNKDTVEVVSLSNSSEDEPVVSQNGSTILIEQKRNHWWPDFSFVLFQKREWTVKIPEDFQKEISLYGSSGDVSVAGPLNLGVFAADLSSGNVEVDEVKAKELSISLTSGDLMIQDSEAEHASLETTSGDMEVLTFSGAMEAVLTSGDFEAEWEEMSGRIDIEVTSGDVEIITGGADLELDVEVSSGDIENDIPLDSLTSQEERSLRGTKGEGDIPLTIRTTSGDVELKE
ncbi:DUF4097 domain-containing protein [Alteribacillus sp. HJP-4]|uniref:DUF4097 domain-containing protein n=1 Tax=Alteribacillus sp. HJP-4 TaxID=2775394 RepID=UPI0035CD0D60